MASPSITVRVVRQPGTAPARPLPYCGQEYEVLKQQCQQRQRLFRDPFFDAVPSSLGYLELGPWATATRGLEWRRPQEICRSPKFIREGMSRTDVEQGQLGNCWFLAAAASLTLYPRLMQRVVPRGQSFAQGDYAGIFHFQFWQYGQWVDVVVDDRLPVKDRKLVFVRSHQRDEFWMPLLEKAYAKLNGSYEAMSGGYMNEAFVDFTGGVGESYPLKLPNPELFQTIRAALQTRSLMGAHIKITQQEDMEAQTPEGLVKGHAYSITGVRTLHLSGRELKLLRLRNPWGQTEWTGRWSDHSPLWESLDLQLQASLRVKKEDGEFWMQMADFLRYFDALEICSLTPDLLEEEEGRGWNVSSVQDRWSIGLTAGGCRSSGPYDSFWLNPQYHLRLRETEAPAQSLEPGCTLLVSLMQMDRRRSKRLGKDFLPIGFEILKMPQEVTVSRARLRQLRPYAATPGPAVKTWVGYLALQNAAARRAWLQSRRAEVWTAYVPMRDVTGRYKLPPGDYLLIPSTGYPLQESDFTLRIFTTTPHEFSEIDDEIRIESRPLQAIANEEAMERAVLAQAGLDKQIDAAGLQDNLNSYLANQSRLKLDGFGLELCQKLVQHCNCSQMGKLTLPEFKDLCSKIQAWEALFLEYDTDLSGTINIHEIPLVLDAAGFHLNRSLQEAITRRYCDRSLLIDFNNFLACMVQLEAIFRQCKEHDKASTGTISMTQEQWLELATLT
ncbi:calpain-12 [Carettochelys insculpta]|uniref:calpain-12 n=1 Tax=Carettochelys insculpta TaxID=44489 RepID=UPI003EB9E481